MADHTVILHFLYFLGFPNVEERVLEAGSFLVMPPFVRQNRQLNDAQNKDCYRISSLRIHVERCIARMKTFGVMRFVSHHMYQHLDKLLVIISFLVNNMPPLIAEKEEEQNDVEIYEIDNIMDVMTLEDVQVRGLDSVVSDDDDDDITFL